MHLTHRHSEFRSHNRTSAIMRVSVAREEYEARRIKKDALESACHVALMAGASVETIAEVSGFSRSTVKGLR